MYIKISKTDCKNIVNKNLLGGGSHSELEIALAKKCLALYDRLANADLKEFIGNVKSNIGNGGFKTKWEQILSKFIVERMTPMNEELNILRNFANAVDNRLQKAEKSAREQDNHHYFKIFAEGVKTLLEKL